MAEPKQQYGQEWLRAQMLKQNAVRVPFAALSSAVQEVIGGKDYANWAMKLFFNPHSDFQKNSLQHMRKTKGLVDLNLLALSGLSTAAFLKKEYGSTALIGGVTGVAALTRTLFAQAIQEKHTEIAETMKKSGVLSVPAEKLFPPDWINPTMVAETHPIFSVQRNGDIIFRRVTPKEFKLLKMQEKWIGKAGVNLWRWRGTLRKPLAPEVERKRVLERLRGLARRYLPMPQPRPAPVLVRKTRLRRITAWRR